jgi:hypothetical protein
VSEAQTLSYEDLGVLFSGEEINGTARYRAMSGAFGALGGDLSAIDVNPAGAAVFNHSETALSLHVRDLEIGGHYYGNTDLVENGKVDADQLGGVIVLKNNRQDRAGWQKLSLAFNYSKVRDFDREWLVHGVSGYAPVTDLYDTDRLYANTEGQEFENLEKGHNSRYSFTVASQRNDQLYVGFSVNTYEVDFYQRTLIHEYNNDGNGNTLDISQKQELNTLGEGLSFSFGLLAKPFKSLRLGLAYQSPIWYQLSEEFVEFEDSVYESNDALGLRAGYSGISAFDYKLSTPAKMTASLALVFGKAGLISADYSYQNYSNIKLGGTSFSQENLGFKNNLEAVAALRLGTEWRIENLSLRGGYHIENSPYKEAWESDDSETFSLGAGYGFRGGRFDIAYQQRKSTAPYQIYGSLSNAVEAAELDFDLSTFTATLVFNL